MSSRYVHDTIKMQEVSEVICFHTLCWSFNTSDIISTVNHLSVFSDGWFWYARQRSQG